MKFKLSNIDAIDLCNSLPDKSIDLIITDPPYESLEKYRKIGTTTRLKHSKGSNNDWFDIFPNSRFEELFSNFYRILKSNSHFYLFCDQETAFIAKPIAESVGFKFWKPLIWDKKKIGMGYHYRSRYEFILFFEKGKLKLNNFGTSDVIECPRIVNGYPTEKPSAVSDILIKQSSKENDIILDPFMGAGPTGIAAISLNRSFIGNDLKEEMLDVARQRILAVGGIESTI